MLFKELKQGDPIYLYDRDKVDLRLESVISVSPSYPDKKTLGRMVVDVTISNSPCYTFHDSSVLGCAGDLMISTDKTCILREVEAQKANNEMLISKVDKLKNQIPLLDAVIDQLSPERLQKRQQEERLSKMEDDISAMKNMFENYLKKNGNYGQ